MSEFRSPQAQCRNVRDKLNEFTEDINGIILKTGKDFSETFNYTP
jgi:hypothetical protein